MSVTLRPLSEDNLSECFQLQVSDEQRNHAQIEETPDMIERILEDASCVPWTIYSGDTMVGFIAYSPVEETSDYQIHRFIVDEKHQGHGYGKSALRQVLEQLSQKSDCERIIINYMSFNKNAASLYEKLGFLETDEFSPDASEDEAGSRFAIYFNSSVALEAELARRQRRLEQAQAQLDELQSPAKPANSPDQLIDESFKHGTKYRKVVLLQ